MKKSIILSSLLVGILLTFIGSLAQSLMVVGVEGQEGNEEEGGGEQKEQEIRVQLGNNSHATIEVEEAELLVQIDHDIPDGFYDLSLQCGARSTFPPFYGKIEVLYGYGAAEITLQDGIYEDCTVIIGETELSSSSAFPTFSISFWKERQDAEDAQKIEGWEHISRINQLLDEAVAKYKDGNYDRAKELVIEAYLYDFKAVESDIEEDDKQLKDKLDSAINEKLQNMISNRRDVSEIESAVAEIKTDIVNAKVLVVSEFPRPSLFMTEAAAVVGIITLLGKVGSSRLSKNK